MTDGKGNLPASVAARLLHRARLTGDVYQTLLTSFCFERFLYRLGESEVRERFVLKGAMLLRLWSDQPYRATRDLDLLRKGDGSFEAIRDDFQTICAVPVEPDAVTFDADTIRIEAIRPEDEYAGARATLTARCGSAHLSLQIDMGLGDSVWPAPQSCVFPALLDFPPPTLLAYPREAVVAEKLEAVVVLGDRNSRIKDFFDLQYLASHFEFDRATVTEAVRRTFARRGTPVPADEPIGLTAAYWENPARPAQVSAFARRAGLTLADDPGGAFVRVLGAFLSPVLEDLRSSARRVGTWPPGGPWRSGEIESDEARMDTAPLMADISATPRPSPPPSQLRVLAERYTAAWCSRDASRVADYYSPNGSLSVNGGAPAVGRGAITEVAQGFMTAFPDMKVLMDGVVVRGDGAVYRWTLVGTNTGPGGKGNRVRISGFEEWRIGDDGLIAESRGHFDAAVYQHQLKHGVEDPP